MKKWRKRVKELTDKLGLTEKMKENTMQNEDWASFNREYKTQYGVDFATDRAADEDL